MPLSAKIHRDVALENVSIAFRPAGLIAQEFPQAPVVRHSDVYYVYSRDNLNVPDTLIGRKGQVQEADFDMSTSSYVLADHGLIGYVSDADKENADKPINLERDTTESLTDRLLVRYEEDMASMIQSSTNWGNNASLTSTLAWSLNTTTSNPITIIDSATSVIVRSCGKLPNVAVMDDPSFRAAKEHVSIVDRVKYTSSDSVSEAMIAKLFGVNRILVGRQSAMSAEEGLTETMTALWTNCCWLGYNEPSPGIRKMSAMYTFRKRAGGSPVTVTRWREDGRGVQGSDAIKVAMSYQHKPVATMCAFLIIDTV